MILTSHLLCLPPSEPVPVARHQLPRPTISVRSSGYWDSTIEHSIQHESTQLYLKRYSTSKRSEDQDYSTRFTQLNLDQLNPTWSDTAQASTQLYLERHSTSINSTLLGAAQHKHRLNSTWSGTAQASDRRIRITQHTHNTPQATTHFPIFPRDHHPYDGRETGSNPDGGF